MSSFISEGDICFNLMIVIYILSIFRRPLSPKFHYFNIKTLSVLILIFQYQRFIDLDIDLYVNIVLGGFILIDYYYCIDIFQGKTRLYVESTLILALTAIFHKNSKLLMSINLLHLYYLALIVYCHSENDESKEVDHLELAFLVFLFTNMIILTNLEINSKRNAYHLFWLLNFLIIEVSRMIFASLSLQDEEDDNQELSIQITIWGKISSDIV